MHAQRMIVYPFFYRDAYNYVYLMKWAVRVVEDSRIPEQEDQSNTVVITETQTQGKRPLVATANQLIYGKCMCSMYFYVLEPYTAILHTHVFYLVFIITELLVSDWWLLIWRESRLLFHSVLILKNFRNSLLIFFLCERNWCTGILHLIVLVVRISIRNKLCVGVALPKNGPKSNLR